MDAITFVFKPNQKVTTPLGETGIIAMAVLDDSFVVSYYVKTKNGSTYWTEGELVKVN